MGERCGIRVTGTVEGECGSMFVSMIVYRYRFGSGPRRWEGRVRARFGSSANL